jgi:hypothetical protein
MARNGGCGGCWRKPASVTSLPSRSPSPSPRWAGSISSSPRHRTRPGNVIPAVTGEGAARPRLGRGETAGHLRLRRRSAHARPVGPGPPQPRPPGRDRLLPRLRTRRHRGFRAGPDRRQPVGGRGVLPGREERMRPGPVRGPPPSGLVPAHHSRHAGPRLPRGDVRHRNDGKGGRGNGSGALAPLTVAEVRRLLAVHRPPPTHRRKADHALSWSW